MLQTKEIIPSESVDSEKNKNNNTTIIIIYTPGVNNILDGGDVGHFEIKEFIFPFRRYLQRLRISFLRIDANLIERNGMVLFEFRRRGLLMRRRVGNSKESDLEVIAKLIGDRKRKQEKIRSR